MKEKSTHDHSLSELGLEHHRFTTKSEIKPWLKRFLLVKRGINIVIERSDSSKIIFKCKTNRNYGRTFRLENGTVKRTNCPFKIRANYSVRNRVWTLVVINDQHNHDIETTIDNENKMEDIRNGGLVLTQGDNIENTPSYMKTSKDEYGKLTDLSPHDEFPNNVCYQEDISKPGSVRIDNFRLLNFGSENSGFKDTRVHKSKQEKSKLDKPNFEVSLEKHNLEITIPDKFKPEGSKADQSENSNSDGKKYKRKKRKKSRSIDTHNFDSILKYLKQEFHSLIENNISKNDMYNENEKGMLFKMFLSLINDDYKDQNLVKYHLFDTPHENEEEDSMHGNSHTHSSGQIHSPDQVQALVQANNKSSISTWLTTPNTPNYALLNMNSASNTNLIPLSPLLNDVEAEYHDSSSANVSQGIDPFIHLPGIHLNAAINQNTVLTSHQMLQIQNQAQQLPSFNFIQNQLPASPTGINTTASLFGNNGNNVLGYSSLIPPINNSNSMTLNPLHLLKSSTKSTSLNPNTNQSTSLSEFRINNSSISTSNTGLLTSQSLNSNNTNSINAGLSSPNNNTIN